MSDRKNTRRRLSGKSFLRLNLIITVAVILLALIFTAGQQSGPVVLAVMIVLTVLILSVTDRADLLPTTLRSILSEIRRIVQPKD